jgi:hypothetical protein
MTDLLIGAADRYDWPDVRPWVKSIKESGFTGDVWLICYRVTDLLKKKCEEHGVNLYEVNHTPYGTPIEHSAPGSPTVAHNYRFYHAWELLTRLNESDGMTIMTDVSDVIFQNNPIPILEKVDRMYPSHILVGSEGIRYENEEWGKDNLIRGFGQLPYDVETRGNWKIYNVGTIGGRTSIMRGLFYEIFCMTEGRYYPSDQSSFNILLRTSHKFNYVQGTHSVLPWAAQCGTTLDPTKSWLWEKLVESRPQIVDNKVITITNEEFYLVHQWNRVPELKKLYTEKYAD